MLRRSFLATAALGGASYLAASRVLGSAPASTPITSTPPVVGGPGPVRGGLVHFVHGLPKAELHVHYEGLLESSDVLLLAARNGVELPYRVEEDVRLRYATIRDLPTFIQVYESHVAVLRTEQDYYDLAWRYFERCRQQNVRRLEMHFDPQLHVGRGIPFAMVIDVLDRARRDAARWLGVDVALIMAFNRDRSAEWAMELLNESEAYREKILGVGLDNPEEPGFPQKFAAVYERARAMGYRLTSHCDVNQPNTHRHIRDVIEVLGVERIDHGVNTIDQPDLIELVRSRGVGLTVCPTIIPDTVGFKRTNFRIRAAAIERMLELDLKVMLNTDDPGFMGSFYLNDIYHACAAERGWDASVAERLARQSFEVSWLSDSGKVSAQAAITRYVAGFDAPL